MKSQVHNFAGYGLAAALFVTGIATPEPVMAQMGTVNNGATAKIDAHGTCRVIRNAGGTGIMVPYKSAGEWQNGGNAFLNNLGAMAGVTAGPCESPPVSCASSREPRWGAYINGSNVRESFYDQRWWWYWNGALLLDTRDMSAAPTIGGYYYNMEFGYYEADNDDISYYPIWRIRTDDNCQPKIDSPNRLKPANIAWSACKDGMGWGRCSGGNGWGTTPNTSSRRIRIYDANVRDAMCLEKDGWEAYTSARVGSENYLAADGVTLILTGSIAYGNMNEWLGNFNSVLDRRAYFMPPGLDTCYVSTFTYLGTHWNDYVQYTQAFTRGVNGVQ